MTRSMADAIGVNAGAALAAGTDLVAGYVTGSGLVPWSAAQLVAAGRRLVTIDNGYLSPPETTATVRDVEPGAWTVQGATNGVHPWTAVRPTIYCSVSLLPSLERAGWRGDVWVADWTGSPPTSPPPVPAGMTCVAVQYTNQGGGGLYDLSVVFDATWPGGEMAAVQVQDKWAWCSKCQVLYYGPNQATSVCPAGGQHAPASGSFDYSLLYNPS